MDFEGLLKGLPHLHPDIVKDVLSNAEAPSEGSCSGIGEDIILYLRQLNVSLCMSSSGHRKNERFLTRPFQRLCTKKKRHNAEF
jgi:hypothetical protein